jgi:hypothetical protein
MTDWTIGFETPPGHPLPYYEITNTADFCLGFMASVIPAGWMLTTVNIRFEAHND